MSKVLQGQVYRLGCKVRSLGRDKFEIITSDVARRYSVNKFNRRIVYDEFDDRKEDMRPFWNEIVASYIEDGFIAVKQEVNRIVFEKQIDNDYVYINIDFSDCGDDYVYRHMIDWNVSKYPNQQKV